MVWIRLPAVEGNFYICFRLECGATWGIHAVRVRLCQWRSHWPSGDGQSVVPGWMAMFGVGFPGFREGWLPATLDAAIREWVRSTS